MTFEGEKGQLNNMVISAEGKFVMTPMSMGLRIAGTAEFTDLHSPALDQRAYRLQRQAQSFLPSLNASQTSIWSGHRPATPDSLPVIGAIPKHPNIYCAFGHGHLGLTLGPTTGRLIAELVSGEAMPSFMDALRVDRFS